MKIAVVDHVINPGGGARMVRSLLPALKQEHPHLDITFFGTKYGIEREHLEEVLIPHGIKIRVLKSTLLSGKDFLKIKGSRTGIALLQNRHKGWLGYLPYYFSGAVHKELESLIRGFDIAFFPWPFYLECPKLSCPMVGVFQDFNYKYYFSTSGFLSGMSQAFLTQHIPDLLARFKPIVTSQFIYDELKKFYPQHAHKAICIPLAPMGKARDKEVLQKTLNKFQIRKPFILYPTNVANHKNIGTVLASLMHVKKKGHDISLVLVGWGTEKINGKACELGIELTNQEQDVFGLGYVGHQEIDALIQSAAVVVNASFYEGNNGPALEAWAHGIPVAMSNIPSFTELLDKFQVKAAVFNPRSPVDIAEKVDQILSQKEKARSEAAHSQESIAPFTWRRYACEYMRVFENLLAEKST
ncbi:MAG TPA: glycosyltransferase [Rhabdochlamydiaceae bacterium]